MTHLLIWLLAYPLVAAVCAWIYADAAEGAKLGQMNVAYAATYLVGFVTIIVMTYV
jgi:hypothetical protein